MATINNEDDVHNNYNNSNISPVTMTDVTQSVKMPPRVQLRIPSRSRENSIASRVSSCGSQTLHPASAAAMGDEEKRQTIQFTDDYNPAIGAKPYSPFYIHPMTETSKMQLHNERQAIRGGTRSSESNDLESGGVRSHGKESTSTRASCDAERWELIKKEKRKGLLGNFSRRTRLIIKLACAALIICVMFGVGIGLTLAVNGRAWPTTGPAKSD